MKTTATNYQKQATDFLNSVNGKITVKYSHYGKHFADDKTERHIFIFRISRNGKSYTAKFGQSIAAGANEPTAYDILSCLTKYEPGTFENFCSDYGYNSDSRAAEKIYKAVKKEFAGVERVFGDVLEQLQEIN